MDDELTLFGDGELAAQVAVLAQTVISIRIARAKTLPRDLPLDSLEWEAAALKFARDVERVLAGESD